MLHLELFKIFKKITIDFSQLINMEVEVEFN